MQSRVVRIGAVAVTAVVAGLAVFAAGEADSSATKRHRSIAALGPRD